MPKRILVVDDSPLMRAILRAMLHADSGEAWDIEEAGGGQDLLDTLAAKGPFDVILLDVQMPGMNGFDACRALREVDRRVPVLFLTAERDFRNFATARGAGGDSYLVKPVSQTTLRSALSALTGMTRRGGGKKED